MNKYTPGLSGSVGTCSWQMWSRGKQAKQEWKGAGWVRVGQSGSEWVNRKVGRLFPSLHVDLWKEKKQSVNIKTN
ncbi:hypothetical protein E2C01_092497 [Portunus trituberculatus]|uniref:Uncharacterized protein n=1 Tax=Portunus trituberculatus TaxID=210409 RepID=A0A5B7JS75_PORTR|nr:hypothetical protein [Portunus trituberculatus]